MPDDPSADFGFQRVPRDDKARRVRGVFDSVAGNYDLMNDLMSAGTHRLWKRFTLALANLRPGQRALDVAGGSGDLAAGMARQVGSRGLVVLSDINAAMLARGRDRLIDEGFVDSVAYVQADAERLPFPDSTFDCITIGHFIIPYLPGEYLIARLNQSGDIVDRLPAYRVPCRLSVHHFVLVDFELGIEVVDQAFWLCGDDTILPHLTLPFCAASSPKTHDSF